MKSNILLVAPHTDDELFGAGGSLLKLKEQGHCIKVVVVSCSDRYLHHLARMVTTEEQWEEFACSAEKLSTEPPLMYDTKNVRIEEVPMYQIVRWLDNVIMDFKPDVFFVPEPSYHQEHKIVYDVCISSVRPTYGRKMPNKIFAYEIPSSTWNGLRNEFKPNVYCCIDDKLKEKISIFKDCYKLQYTETARVALGENGIIASAKYRGFESGYDNAEAFMLIKGISPNGDILT